MLVNYCVTIIAYLNYREDFYHRCDHLYSCFLETWDKTFKMNGGVGTFIDEITP